MGASSTLACRLQSWIELRCGAVIGRAVQDLIEGLYNWRLWSLLAWQDIRLRYRRSMLGPFWLTLSMAFTIASLGFVYGKLFHMEMTTYLPYLTLGFLTWSFISSNVVEGCTALTAAEPFIRQVRLPFSVYVLRSVFRNVIIFAHNFVVYIAVIILFGIWPGAAGLWFIPAFVLIMLNALWATLLFAMICARFRDIGPIIASLLQIGFFLTPILWKKESLTEHLWVVTLNPFHYLVEVIRAPLLGEAPQLQAIMAVTVLTLGGWAVALTFFGRFRNRIPYWV